MAMQVGWQPWKWSNFKMPDNLKDIKLSSSKNRNKWQEKYGDACKDRRLDSWSTRSDSPSNAISPKAQKRSEHSFPSRLQQRSDNKESTTWQNSSLQFSKPQNITTALEDDFATIDPPESIWTKRLAQQQKDVVAKISQSEPQSISPSLRVEKTAAEQDKPQIRISPPVEQNQIHPAAPSLGVGAFLASRDEFQNASQASFQPYSAPVRLYSNPQIPDSDPQIPDSNPQIPDSDPQIPVEATSAYIQEAKIDVQASSQKTPQSARKDPYNQHNEENVLQISESSVENLTQRKVGSQKKQPSSTWIQDKNRTQRWREYDASVSAKDRQIKNPNFSSAMNSRLVDPVPSNTARGLDTSSNLLIMTQQRDQTSQNLPGSFDMFAMQRPVLAEGAGKLENREVALIPEDECASHTEDFFHKMPTPEDFFHKMPTPVTVPKTSSDKHLDALHSFSESQGVLLPTKSIGEHIVDLKQADYSNWSIEDSEGLPSTENLAQSFANVPSEYRRVAPRSLATFQPYRPESGESNTGESVSDANALDYLLRPHAHSPAVAESDSKSTENGKVLIPSIQRNLRAIDTQTDDHSAASMGLSKVPRQHDIEDSHPNQTVVDFNSKFVPLEPLANYHLANSFTTLQRSTGTERLLSNIHSHLDFPHPALLGVQNGGFIQPASQQEIHSVSGLSDPRFEVKSSVNMQDQCQRQNTAIQFSQRRPNGTAASFSEFSQQPSKKSELPKVPPGFTGVWQGWKPSVLFIFSTRNEFLNNGVARLLGVPASSSWWMDQDLMNGFNYGSSFLNIFRQVDLHSRVWNASYCYPSSYGYLLT